ncbi:MAG: hypothetical protein LBJ14_10240 [Desulfarculales bacterium]|jgi:hypothetical protein|nr:hypothetical protein [Desulfarculales bacterium]
MSFYKDKSLFWRYFRDTLALGFITVPGTLAVLAHGLARSMDTVRRDLLWVRDQFVPPKAEDEYIPLHGASRGAPQTRFDSASRYRRRVERAAAWHKLGGKIDGLPEIIKEYGFSDGVIHNCREDDPDLWAHFDLNLINPPLDFSAGDVDTVFALANQYKPGRSVIQKIQFAKQHWAGVAVAAAGQVSVMVETHVAAKQALPPQPVFLYRGAAGNLYITVNNFVRS